MSSTSLNEIIDTVADLTDDQLKLLGVARVRPFLIECRWPSSRANNLVVFRLGALRMAWLALEVSPGLWF
ncbi:hypothetical protein [Absidia glauca]|uniref:Uncharacterized protein n=1 Tax=Absidia glauca TaxID=4829 RepID=A0A168LX34_ABSGL|nr:hypothetical protein [Absidia glauca]